MEGPILIDDRDPAVHYDDHWYIAGVAEEFNATTHSASVEGAQAILTFTGTSVAVYGTLHAPGTPGISTYSIDGKPATTKKGSTSSVILYRHLLYQSPPLDNGEHTLTITPTTWQPGGFWLDYFSVTPNHVTPQPASHTAVPPSKSLAKHPPNSRSTNQEHSVVKTTLVNGTSSTVTSVIIIESVFPTSVSLSSYSGVKASSSVSHSSIGITPPTQIPPPPPATDTKPTSRVAIIIGSVLGGIVLILILIAIFFALRASRRRKFSHHVSPMDTLGDDTGPLIRETLSFHKSPTTGPQLHSDPPLAPATRDARPSIPEPPTTASIDAPPMYIERMSRESPRTPAVPRRVSI